MCCAARGLAPIIPQIDDGIGNFLLFMNYIPNKELLKTNLGIILRR